MCQGTQEVLRSFQVVRPRHIHFRIMSEYGIGGFFTAPTALRSIMREDEIPDHMPNYDISK